VDITQLKATQRELELSRERLSLATAAAKFGVWDIDLSTGTLVWDDMMHVHFGTDPKKFRGRFEDWSERVHPEDLPAAESAFREALDGGDDFDTVFRVCRPNGSIAYLGGKAIVHFRHGKAYRVVGVNWDMTEQREAELTLKANENLLRDFVRHAPAAIAMLDKNLCYLQTSDRWLKDYGLDGEDLTGRPHYEVFPDQPERWKAIHQEALRGKVQACSEDPFPRADGRCEWLQWEVRPWYDAYGLVGGVIFFTQVITQRKEMELRLEVQRNELQRSNKDLEQFAYAASHDLQEPLRAVSGCAQLLRDRYEEQLDPMGFELIAHIVEGADRMKTLISDLLTYSRVNNGDPFTNVDTEQVLQDVLALLRDSISESGATICHDRLPTVTGAYSQLRQLFQNLIGNAIKYRAERPLELKISVAEHNSSHWRFSFADNGIGIEPRHLRRIFGIFQRLHTRLEYPGTGIGLALCQKIVTRHGGRLWVDSALGRGATFKFTILKGESHERQ
jgi:PAS domain S-box-containing protein